MSAERLPEAIKLVRAGQKDQARLILQQIVMEDPGNETAWLWFVECLPTLTGRIQALETFVQMNPEAQRARLGLNALRAKAQQAGAAGPAKPAIIPAPPSDAVTPPTAPLEPAVPVEPAVVEPAVPVKPAETRPDVIYMPPPAAETPARPEAEVAPFAFPDFGQPGKAAEPPEPLAAAGESQPPVFTKEVMPENWDELRQRLDSDPDLRKAAEKAGLKLDLEAEPAPSGPFTMDFSDQGAPAEAAPTVPDFSSLDFSEEPAHTDAFTVDFSDNPDMPLDLEDRQPVSAFSAPIDEALITASPPAAKEPPAIRPLKHQTRASTAVPTSPKAKPARKTGRWLAILFISLFVIGLVGIATVVIGLALTGGLF